MTLVPSFERITTTTASTPSRIRLGRLILQRPFRFVCFLVLYAIMMIIWFGSFQMMDLKMEARTTTLHEWLVTSKALPPNTNITNTQRQSSSTKRLPFLSYQLYYGDRPYNVTYGYFTKCYVGRTTNKWGRKPIRRDPLAQPLAQLLNVTTYLQTNLRILMLGDSVGIQLHQLLEEAAGVTWHQRRLYTYAWGEHEAVSIAAPVDGGGVLAAFRMTGMLLHSGRGKPPPNAPGGGWLPEHAELLLNHTYYYYHDQPSKQRMVQRFDSMVFRIPHGWLTLGEINRDTLMETLMLAHQIFGITTAIILTLPLNNNVKTMEELQELRQVNVMIKDTINHWSDIHRERTGVNHVLLMDFGTWTDQLTEWNARMAGLNRSLANYTLQRLGCSKHPPSIAMICTHPVPAGSCSCTRNMISIDGMHWCMESIGGRVTGAIACLLQCPLRYRHEDDKKEDATIQQCEQFCNRRFLSFEAIGKG